jgi:hypothetical protein
MNHYRALQRQTNGRWDYTCNGRPTGYCHAWIPFTCPPLPEYMVESATKKFEPLIGNFHTDGHATEEEAWECYKRYQLDTRLRFSKNSTQQRKCVECDDWTDKYAVCGYHMWWLCEVHATREYASKHWGQESESWES